MLFLSIFVVCEISMYWYCRLKTIEKSKLRNLFSFLMAFICIFVLTFFFAFRDLSIGVDTFAYEEVFRMLGKDVFSKKLFEYEPLYSFVNIVTNRLFGSFNVCMLIVGLITFINIFYSIDKLSDNPALSMAIFIGLGMYAQSFNAVRQYMALSFVLVALVFLIKKNKNWLAALFIILATLCHKSAIITLAFIVLKYIKFNKKSICLIGACSVVSIFMFPVLGKIFDFLFNTYYYEVYSQWAKESFDLEHILAFIIYIAIFAVIVYYKYKLKDKFTQEENKKYDFFALAYMGFVVFNFIAFFTTEVLARLGIYCLIALLFIPPLILKYLENKQRLVYTILLHVALIIFMIIILYVLKLYGVVPYKLIFN